MSASPYPDYAFVFGAPRSGTTFVMEVLEAVPGSEAVTGNLFPIALAHLAGRPLEAEAREAIERGLRGALRDYTDSAVYRARLAALRKWWLASRRPAGLRQALRGERNERVLVYKEPFFSLAPELAYEALPGSRIVYLVRDGRDVADSMVRKYDTLSDQKLAGLESNEAPLGRRVGELYAPWWVAEGEEEAFLAADPYGRAIWLWREMNARCQALLARPDVAASGRVLTVRYEELTSDPVAVGQRLIDHLGLPMGGRARRRLEAAHVRSQGIHRRRDPRSVAAAEAIAAAELRRLGYEPAPAAEPAPIAP